MRERYTPYDLFRDIAFETDRKIKEQHQTRQVPTEVKDIVRHTAAHKPGVRNGK